ncbi:hypothetical protein AX769_20790 (plasmid) [Frondihabitans sp. PAMC 28766]|nr:hypothetical protein AX769_20790 [Frondihabitans sp. PAMC 28766]
MTSDIAFEAASDLSSGFTLCRPPIDVGPSSSIGDHAGAGDNIHRPVQLTVAAAAETVPDDVAAGGLEWGDAGETGEGGFGSDAPSMRIGREDDGPGDRPDAFDVQKPGREFLDVMGQSSMILIELPCCGENTGGESFRFRSDCSDDGVVRAALTPPTHGLHLRHGQRAACVDAEAETAKERGKHVVVGGSTAVQRLTSDEEDSQC